jgi:alcohol dehydrogenase
LRCPAEARGRHGDRLLPMPQPLLLVGPGASARLGQAVGDFGHSRVLLVTDAVVLKLGLAKG